MGPEQLGHLMDAHAAALVLYARQWCASPEDVVQEAFVQLARVHPVPDPILPWLYRVVRNAALSALRAERRRRHHETRSAAEKAGWFQPTEGAALDAELASVALQALPLEQREVVIARLWGELTFEQIAELVGTSSSSAHRLYQAGLATLRERLTVQCPDPETK